MASARAPADLAYYEDPDLYEQPFRHRREDIEYFRALARSAGGPVLEYGCGSGRVTIPLAQDGASVTGVDLSAPMLERLEQRLQQQPEAVRARVSLRAADMRRLRLRSKFPLVLATFNVVGHLATWQDARSWLRRVKDCLAPGGELVFDVPLPAAEELEAEPEARLRLPRFRHPVTGQWVLHDERYEYGHLSQVLLVESDLWAAADKGKRRKDILTTRLWLRQWFPRELESLLRYEGFDVKQYADYSERPVGLTEEMVIVRARLEL